MKFHTVLLSLIISSFTCSSSFLSAAEQNSKSKTGLCIGAAVTGAAAIGLGLLLWNNSGKMAVKSKNQRRGRRLRDDGARKMSSASQEDLDSVGGSDSEKESDSKSESDLENGYGSPSGSDSDSDQERHNARLRRPSYAKYKKEFGKWARYVTSNPVPGQENCTPQEMRKWFNSVPRGIPPFLDGCTYPQHVAPSSWSAASYSRTEMMSRPEALVPLRSSSKSPKQ